MWIKFSHLKTFFLLLLDEILAYIRSLEQRLGLTHYPEADSFMTGEDESAAVATTAPSVAVRRPDAVSNAFKVLSIQERILEKSSAMDSSGTDTENELGEGERALVQEICKVGTFSLPLHLI
jgi:hypothetical protein